MIKDAERLFEQLKDKSERGKFVFKLKSDPRVTRVGKFLRRYSIDELPQIVNVLRGEMSLVGPRPQIEYEAQSVLQHSIYKRRYNVLPGITGLWQVSGRADLDFEDMMKLDLYYVEHWSLGLDLQIIIRTVFAVLSGKGAY
jgi:lipopolysaccharide/colanic/teichoic acid biosynthesis glycosyltransferase